MSDEQQPTQGSNPAQGDPPIQGYIPPFQAQVADGSLIPGIAVERKDWRYYWRKVSDAVWERWAKLTRTQVTEESGIQKEWYNQATKVRSRRQLNRFIKKLTTKYIHDYGTICHACAASAIAAAYCVDRSDQGWITGFQAQAIMWEFVTRWAHKEGPLRLVEYHNMLYISYEQQFSKTITKNTWEYLQREATRLLKDEHRAHPDNLAHWRSIAEEKKVPFGYTVAKEGDE